MSNLRHWAIVAVAGIAALAVGVVAVGSALGAYRQVERGKLEARMTSELVRKLFDPRYPLPSTASRDLAPAGETLARHPLDSDVLARAGLRAAIGGDTALATKLMTQVMQRDPRSRAARLWALRERLNSGNVGSAIEHLDRLLALDPQQQDVYFPLLADLGKLPNAEGPLRRILAHQPPWRERFLGYLTTRNVDPALVFRLTSAKGDSGVPGAQTAVLQQLIAKKDFDGAYLAWINFLPDSAIGKVASVYDGGFEGLPGPQPFNWQFHQSEAASVGIERGQGLQIDYPGTQNIVAATQMLLLKPGQYRIDYNARGNGTGGDAGTLSWRIVCTPETRPLLTWPIAALKDTATAHATRFAVPEGCDAQLLTLEANAGAFPNSQSVTIGRVSIRVLG